MDSLQAQIEHLLQTQDDRVHLARQQAETELERLKLETLRVEELQRQNANIEKTLAQEAEWQRIEQLRIAQIDRQAQRVKEFSRKIAMMREEHDRILKALKECKTYLEIVVRILQIITEKVISSAEKEESRQLLESLISQFKQDHTIIGAVSAGQDAHLAGHDLKKS